MPESGIPLYTGWPERLRDTRYAQWCDLRRSPVPPQPSRGAVLWLDAHGLQLHNAALAAPLHLTPALLARRLSGKSLLLRACGRPAAAATVLDACAGFGLDALTLLHHGYAVTANEWQRLVWLMQVDYAERLQQPLVSLCEDAGHLLQRDTQHWDVVYLDPMFPQRRKRALPNLALQHLQQLSQPQAAYTVDELLTWAQRCARQRVVLKRRPKDPTVGQPAHQVRGQSVRFDVYL